MAIGDDAKVAVRSYVAVGKETTFGTYASATSALEAISCTFRTDIESEKLDTFGPNRGFTKRVQLNKVVGGTLEAYLHPIDSVLMLAAAMGGGITTSSETGATLHAMNGGNFDTTPGSLSFNVRKGSDHTWRYSGGRVNVLTIAANVGEPVRLTAEFVFKDSTQQADDISAALSISSVQPFVYTGGVLRYATTEALANTTTAEERIQGFELTVNNNFDVDAGRELGTNIPRVIPAKRRDVQLKVMQRFDTTTTYNRFIQATQGSIELQFSGDSMTAEYAHLCRIRLPKVFLNSPDPELGGADEVLSSEITYDVLVDSPSTLTGADIKIAVRNSVAAY